MFQPRYFTQNEDCNKRNGRMNWNGFASGEIMNGLRDTWYVKIEKRRRK
jgi:hypothetical protein